VASVHAEMFRRADPVYMSHNSMTLWEHARDDFDTEALHRTDLVVPTGFLLLPWGTSVTDVRGVELKYRAIAWMPVSQRTTYQWDEDVEGQGVWFSLLSHADDADEALDPELRDAARQNGWRWALMHGTPLAFGQKTWEQFEGAEADQVQTLHRHVLSLWRLMSQLVPTKTRLHLRPMTTTRRPAWT
jgi:hypothetical protein